MERWKVIGEYSDYEISDFGNIRRGTKVLKPMPHHKGYLKIRMTNNNGRRGHFIHRLVADAFLPNIYNYPQVNHKDADKRNNKWFNLEWVNQSENMLHAYALGLKSAKGEMNGRAKITADIARAIRNSKGPRKDIVARFGVSESCVKDIKANRSWVNV